MQLSRIEEARENIAPYIIRTPLIPVDRLKQQTGFTPWLKLENMQNIGAFKIRGALNAALNLSEAQIARGLVTASSGNHGTAVAYAAKMLHTSSLIVLPNTVNPLKLNNIKALGAGVVLTEPQERIRVAHEIADLKGMTFIHPFDDDDVIAGQGTIGIEILEQFPGVQQIVVPMGGGGLISGIALAAKQINPQVRIIGVETAAVPKFSMNMERNEPIPVSAKPSVADALLSNMPGRKTLLYVKQFVDEVVAVEETNLMAGYQLLLKEGKILCEPSSSIGFGAFLQGCFSHPMEKTVFVISGGNSLIPDFMK